MQFKGLSQLHLKTLTLLSLQFYQILLLFNIACTLLSIAVFWYGFGHIDAGIFFLAKIFGFPGAVLLHQYSAKETYFYFRNAGFRMRRVIGIAFIIDLLAYLTIFLLFSLISYAAGHFKG